MALLRPTRENEKSRARLPLYPTLDELLNNAKLNTVRHEKEEEDRIKLRIEKIAESNKLMAASGAIASKKRTALRKGLIGVEYEKFSERSLTENVKVVKSLVKKRSPEQAEKRKATMLARYGKLSIRRSSEIRS